VPADAGGYGSMLDPGLPPCVSNLDCPNDEFCIVTMGHYDGCLGVGVCYRRGNASGCGDGTAASFASCATCGCDGVTYLNQAAAWAAGVNEHTGVCGVQYMPRDAGAAERLEPIPCGYDSQCPAGRACCAITGTCYDPACRGCCQIPPLGTEGPCERSSDCPRYAPFCRGGPACDGPGFCVGPQGNCGGEVATVCGCNGTTYSNACWAELALTRVAHAGPCP
jgi:hypothetical protein